MSNTENITDIASNPSPATNFLMQEDVEKPYRVYVLQNPTGRLYIGLSENPAIRLVQHNSGVSKWTRGRGPWKIIWESNWLTLTEARKLENKLKRQKGGHGLYQMIGLSMAHNPALAGS